MTEKDQKSTLLWRGIKIMIDYKSNYFESKSGFSTAHLDITTENRVPLPFTESGYRSHFLDASELEQYGTPNDFVKAWLEETAKSEKWKKQEHQRNQLSLF